ncbi:CDP-diacylglycerol-inositol 3-phosphatidyltransferase, partial [Podochytrium sp. JEL0797]
MAPKPTAQGPSKVENVFLFVPNVIGYIRLVLCAASCVAMANHPILAIVLYSVSCLLDAADGYAARALDQSSRFGAVQDMVLDRLTTLCLLVRLALQLPAPLVLFIQFLAALDLASHYSHMYASLVTGSESHKKLDPNAPYLLRMYYQSKLVLFMVCLLDQWFYIAVYLLTWRDAETGDLLFLESAVEASGFSHLMAEGVGSLLKTVLIPLIGSGYTQVAIVVLEETGPMRAAIWVIAGFSGLVCLFKQVLNVIQMVGAYKDLAAFD